MSFAGHRKPNSFTSQQPTHPAMPNLPQKDLIGPLLRFVNYDPTTCRYTASVLVVCRPETYLGLQQLFYGVDGYPPLVVQGNVIDRYNGWTFIRFDLALNLIHHPQVWHYYINFSSVSGFPYRFTVPAATEPWRWVFYSCNGFHDDKVKVKYNGIQPLWSDLLQQHSKLPYHVQVGGGDQLYNDHVWELHSTSNWMKLGNTDRRYHYQFTDDMKAEVEYFYFSHYCQHFSEKLFDFALATIPYVYTWDDHDIFDGWGSYPTHLQISFVFQGVYECAKRFYLLFQHHTNERDAYLSGGLFGGGKSFNMLKMFGQSTAILLPDTRAERTREQVVSQSSWDMIKRGVEHLPATVRHLVVCLPVPIIYPKIPLTEGFLSQFSGQSKNALWFLAQKTGLSQVMMSKFDEPEILDDLLDHWTAGGHSDERRSTVMWLQEIAAKRRIRVSFISGDVHCAAVGRFYTHPKLNRLANDHRFMPQIVSSAIGNEPPPMGVIKAFHATDHANDVFPRTREKMVKSFPNNSKLYPNRNYCEVHEAQYTPSVRGDDSNGNLRFVLRCQSGLTPPTHHVDVWSFEVPIVENVAP